jgi:signal transduction histidine kinase
MTELAASAVPASAGASHRRWAPLLPFLVALLPILLSYLVPEAPQATARSTARATIVSADERSQPTAVPLPDVPLPDSWNITRKGFAGTIDYAFALPPATDKATQLAVYIPRVKNTCDLLLDGHVIYSESEAGQSRGWNRVVFTELPPATSAAARTLTVRVHGLANDLSGLSEVYIGPSAELRPTYLKRWFIQEELPKLANFLVIAMALPLAMLWFRDPRNSLLYGLFAFGSVMFALRNFQRQFDLQLLPPAQSMVLISVTLGLASLPLWVFFTRYVGQKIVRFERFILIFTITGSIVLWFIPAKIYVVTETLAWRAPMLLSGFFCVYVVMRETFRSPSRARLLMACALIAQVAPATHDLLWTLGVFPFASIQWFPLSFPVLLVVMGLLLADDVAVTKGALREANTDLERKIALARTELDALYERKRQADAETVTVEERHRLMRDMHDGVGTHLSLLLTSLKSGGLSQKDVTDGVQSSLDELRLLIDARSSSTQTIADALANLRHRLQARLAPLGITTKWEVSEGADALKLSAEATLHVLRIVQECINNAVRHGGAREITLQVGADGAGNAFVAVKDNGCGVENAQAATRGNGQGLKSIFARAKSIGGSFALTREGDVTVAMLSFPGG